MIEVGQQAEQRVAGLRDGLMGGRGVGASPAEVAEHTRDRSMLGAVAAPVERALVAGQADHVRAGGPIDTIPDTERARKGRQRAAMYGALAALLVRAIGARLRRSLRRATTP